MRIDLYIDEGDAPDCRPVRNNCIRRGRPYGLVASGSVIALQVIGPNPSRPHMGVGWGGGDRGALLRRLCWTGTDTQLYLRSSIVGFGFKGLPLRSVAVFPRCFLPLATCLLPRASSFSLRASCFLLLTSGPSSLLDLARLLCAPSASRPPRRATAPPAVPSPPAPSRTPE